MALVLCKTEKLSYRGDGKYFFAIRNAGGTEIGRKSEAVEYLKLNLGEIGIRGERKGAVSDQVFRDRI